MAEAVQTTSIPAQKGRRTRGPSKSFPIVSLESILLLPKGIIEHGVGDKIRRITLFGKLGKSPDSGQTRQLISSSNKYGLTAGSYAAEYLEVTADGRGIAHADVEPREKLELEFKIAFSQFETFAKLYERLKNKKVPDLAVLKDELAQLGVAEGDRSTASTVFIENARFLGLIQEVSGSERLVPLEQAIEELDGSVTGSVQSAAPEAATARSKRASPPETATAANFSTAGPSIHIDIQIHIDSSASADQIDQIFASMARHLYGPKG